MEQACPDSTVLPARQAEPERSHDTARDERITQILAAAPAALPAAGSKAAWDAYGAACHEHTLRTQFANDYPDLHRDTSTWWTQRCLGRALETGDITPSAAARLFPLASERELRMAQVEHDLNMGALHALAFADQYPLPADDVVEDWQDPPPGFMASPAIEPTSFARIPDALRIELNRLLVVAMAEFYRRTEGLREHMGEGEALAREAEIRAELFLLPLTAAIDPESAGGRALAALNRPAGPDPIFAAIAASRRAEAEMKAFGEQSDATSQPGWLDREAALADAQCQARYAVWDTAPTTQAGRLALVEYANFHISLYGAELAPGTDNGVPVHEILKAFKAAVAAERSEAPVATPITAADPRLAPDRAWAVAQAAAVDLSDLTVQQLCNLFERVDETADRWLDITHIPWTRNEGSGPFVDQNAAGRLVSREQDRMAEIRTRIAHEIERREPGDDWERDQRLEMLLRYEMMCNGNLRHAPGLRAQIAMKWGA